MIKTEGARLVRLFTLPPVVIALLAGVLLFGRSGVFASLSDALLTFIFLGLIPALAYPVARVVPKIAVRGRNGSRTLAMLFSLAGYFGGWLWAWLAGGRDLRFLFTTYLLSLLLLLVLNFFFRFRASGHATALSGPFLFSFWYYGVLPSLAFLLLWGVVYWASVAARHHSSVEYLGGTAVAMAAFVLSLPVYFFA